jgi:hypothetical protein
MKPIFIIRVPAPISIDDVNRIHDSEKIKPIKEDYHVVVISGGTSCMVLNGEELTEMSFEEFKEKISATTE